jgi:hypothetical protein
MFSQSLLRVSVGRWKTFLIFEDQVISDRSDKSGRPSQSAVETNAAAVSFLRECCTTFTGGDAVARYPGLLAAGVARLAGVGAGLLPTPADPQPPATGPAAEAHADADRAEPPCRAGKASEFPDQARVSAASVSIGHDPTGGVDSHHLRAARALLGWAMSDLARTSGLSLSTIRRLEQNSRAVSARNHRSAVNALRAGGIRFLTLDDGTIALAEVGHLSAQARLAEGDQAGEVGRGTPGSGIGAALHEVAPAAVQDREA